MYNLLFTKIFTLKGRSSRKEYIYKFIISFIFFILAVYTKDKCLEATIINIVYLGILIILIDILIIQYFPLAIRRLHDLNASGWYILLMFVPFGQLLILWLMFKKGTTGPNKYGDPPKY